MLKKSKRSIIVSYIVLFIFALVVIVPFVWMISSSFKGQRELYAFPPTLFPNVWKFSNYVKAATTGSIGFGRMFLNTMSIALPITVFSIIFASMAAYSFARIRFPGRNFLFMLFISSMMIPVAVTMIPTFMMFSEVGLYNTYAPLILPEMFGKAFAIFLLRQFFMTVPADLEEAAVIDGCGRLRIWSTIFLPLSKPIIATLAIFTFQRAYNDFMNPVIYINSSDKFTIQLGLAAFRNAYTTRYDLMMAGSVLALLPVVVIYLLCQKYIVKGIVMTGIKG